jgi:hypothetical protein
MSALDYHKQQDFGRNSITDVLASRSTMDQRHVVISMQQL